MSDQQWYKWPEAGDGLGEAFILAHSEEEAYCKFVWANDDDATSACVVLATPEEVKEHISHNWIF